MAFDLILTFFLVFLNGFFVAAEFAIVKVRSSQLSLSAQSGNRAAILAKNIVSHLDGYLAATQLGITLASLGLGWIGEPVVSKIILQIMAAAGSEMDPETAHTIALPVAFAFITVMHIVFGELAPKSIAIQHSARTSIFLAYPLRFFFIIFRPFIWILNGVANAVLRLFGIHAKHGGDLHSSEELKILVQQGAESGAIEVNDYDIIKNAFDFSDRTARQVMIPRTQVMAINIEEFDDKVLERILEENYSRIPCYEKTLDNIVGVVLLKDMLLQLHKKGEFKLLDIIQKVAVYPLNTNVSRILKDFQVKHRQIGIVVNEYGGTEGIITMEDILEELVGEIQDEFDNEIPFVEYLGDGVYTVLASARMDEINKSLPHSLVKHPKYEKLAGYLMHKFGKIPNTGERIILDDYEVTILKKTRNSIALVQFKDLAE